VTLVLFVALALIHHNLFFQSGRDRPQRTPSKQLLKKAKTATLISLGEENVALRDEVTRLTEKLHSSKIDCKIDDPPSTPKKTRLPSLTPDSPEDDADPAKTKFLARIEKGTGAILSCKRLFKSADKAIQLATTSLIHPTAEDDLVVPTLTPLTRGYENLLITELNIINFGYERFDDNNNDLGFNASRWASAPRQLKSQTAPFILDRKYLDLLEAYSEASHRIMKEKRRFLFLSIDLSKLSKPVIDAMNVLDRLTEAVFIFTNDFKDILKPRTSPFSFVPLHFSASSQTTKNDDELLTP
jgi:hypothetical protein